MRADTHSSTFIKTYLKKICSKLDNGDCCMIAHASAAVIRPADAISSGEIAFFNATVKALGLEPADTAQL